MSPRRMAAFTLATAVELGHFTLMRAGQSRNRETTQLCVWVGHRSRDAVGAKSMLCIAVHCPLLHPMVPPGAPNHGQ